VRCKPYAPAAMLLPLASCPFCAAAGELVAEHPPCARLRVVRSGCHASAVWKNMRELAAEAWNQRAPPASPEHTG